MPVARGDQLVMRAVRADLADRAFDVSVRPKQNAMDANSLTQTVFYENELWVRAHLPRVSSLIIAEDAFEDERSMYLVNEARDVKCDLLQYISAKGTFSEVHARIIFSQVVSALSLCHENNVVHRDIKLPAIYLDPTFKKAYLSGFRFAEVLKHSTQLLTDRRGSPAYVSPEMLRSKQYLGQSADVWSLGIVLYIMLCGAYPFVDQDPKKLFEKIMTGKLYLPGHLSGPARQLLTQMLERKPDNRITLAEIVRHPFMSVSDDEEQMVPN